MQEEATIQAVPLWRNRDYMLLWSGQAVSVLGTQVSQFAFPLLVLFLTGSAAQAGIAAAARVIPYLLFSLPAGALLDRWDRKRVMILCDAGRAIVLVSVPLAYLFGWLSSAQLYIVSFCEGSLFVFFNIAQISCLPQIVPKPQLTQANAQNLTMTKLLTLLGPTLGGILYTIGSAVPFLADAISYTASVSSLFLIQAPFQKQREGRPRRLWHEVGEGLAWLWRDRTLRALALLTAGSNFVTSGFPLIAVVIAQNLHADSLLLGLTFTIGGIGGIIGALLAPSTARKFKAGRIILYNLWLEALCWFGFALGVHMLIVGIVLAACLFLTPFYDVITLSYRMTMIPDELQARTNSVFRLLVFSAQPLGLSCTGFLLQAYGPRITVLLTGACLLLFASIGTFCTSLHTMQMDTATIGKRRTL